MHVGNGRSSIRSTPRCPLLKTARLGYDGKGQQHTREELAAAWQAVQVPHSRKDAADHGRVSVIVARGADGRMVHLPPQRNLHRGGILAVTEVAESAMPQPQARQAIAATESIAQGLQYVGVLCVEFFLLADGTLVVNEMAPRPQQQQALEHGRLRRLAVRAPGAHARRPAADAAAPAQCRRDAQPPGRPVVRRGQERAPAWDAVLRLPGTHLHLYGKLEARRGRKMGHLNVTAATAQQARETALAAAALLGIAPF